MTTKTLHKHDESWYYHLSRIKWDFWRRNIFSVNSVRLNEGCWFSLVVFS